MNVLVGCEFSAIVRQAFARRGHNAWSCDLLPSEIPGNHYQKNLLDVIDGNWDLLIAHPPCTFLAVSGARWWKGREKQQEEAIAFVLALFNCGIPKIAIENPIGKISSVFRPPDQIIQPWMFGHGETKATCLWLKGLPLLHPTHVVQGRMARVHRMPPSPQRGKERSRTFFGIAEAMADQWGNVDFPCIPLQLTLKLNPQA